MILYLESEYKDYAADTSKYETKTLHLDLVGSDISTVEFDPGVIIDLTNKATAIAKISIHGKPALTHASSMLGRFRIYTQTSIGRNFGSFVYCYYSPTDDRQIYRAKVFAIDFAPEKDASYFNRPDRHMPATLSILHGPWQGNLTQLPLSVTGMSGKTLSPYAIQNSTDGFGNKHTAMIAAEDIDGDLPAPIKLEIVNRTGASVIQYWVSMNVNSTPQLFTGVLEGEDATGAIVAHPAASAGNVGQITIPNTTEADVLTWNISSADTTIYNGNQFHTLIRSYFGNPLTANIYVRFKIKDAAGLSTFWTGEQVFFPVAGITRKTHDYGVIRIPPWRVDRNIVDPSGIKLIMSAAQITTAAAITVDIDAVFLLPVDGFRNIIFTSSAGGQLPDDGTVIDDCIENFSYVIPSGSTSIGAVGILGNPIVVYPRQDNRIILLTAQEIGGNDDADLESEIRVWYRPQRLTI